MGSKRRRLLALALVLCTSSNVWADDRDRAKRMHERLTGTPPTANMLNHMAGEIGGGDPLAAALAAIDGGGGVSANGHFYNVVVKNWASPWTNEAQQVGVDLNDYSATVIGMVRDELDFREILSGNILYRGNTAAVPGLSPYSNDNNTHYRELEQSAANLADSNVLVADTQTGQGLAAEAVAGVMTTRAAASAFFIDGTNRAMLRFTLLNHLCLDLEQLKDNSRPADRIRQDVSRSPGLDSRLFLNQCASCHAGMDPLAQAFAYYEYYPSMSDRPDLSEEERRAQGHLVYSPNQVQAKYHINANNFAPGYVTPNDHWTNYWRLGVNSGKIGWRQPASNSGSVDLALNSAYSEGDGAASLGRELANTEAFASCQMKKVFRAVCHREPAEADRVDMDALITDFHANHNIKQSFARAAVACSVAAGGW